MKNINSLKPLVILPNVPAAWPSASQIQHGLSHFLESHFSSADAYDFLGRQKLPKNRDFWIFPFGTVQAYTLNWLRTCFRNPMSRPPALFILAGEGSKLGYHLLHFKDVFRPDDQWLVGCEAEKRLLEMWFPKNNRTHVMYYPVSPTFRPARNEKAKQELRRKLALPVNRQLVLYAGRISQQKNTIATLELLKRFPKLKMIVCGDTDSVGVPHLQNVRNIHVPSALADAMTKLGISEQIEFRPFQSQSQLRMIMQACDYQVSLSAHFGEDFGYSIAQGINCGLKSILSNWGGHRNWQSLNLDEQFAYIELDWQAGVAVGAPILPPKLKMPHVQIPESLNRTYSQIVQAQFYAATQSLLAAKERGPSLNPIKASPSVIKFWKQIAKKPRPVMFESAQNPLFRAVVETYQGK